MIVNFSFAVGQNVKLTEEGIKRSHPDMMFVGVINRIIIERDGSVMYEVEQEWAGCTHEPRCAESIEYPPEELEAA